RNVTGVQTCALPIYATSLNANGNYITSLPFNPTFVQSTQVPEGKAVFFVKGEYIAAVGGSLQMKKFDQTLAMEDATLYIAKQYATGRPVDNTASVVYELKLDGGGGSDEGGEDSGK